MMAGPVADGGLVILAPAGPLKKCVVASELVIVGANPENSRAQSRPQAGVDRHVVKAPVRIGLLEEGVIVETRPAEGDTQLRNSADIIGREPLPGRSRSDPGPEHLPLVRVTLNRGAARIEGSDGTEAICAALLDVRELGLGAKV